MLRVSSACGISLSQRLSGKLGGGAAQSRNEVVLKGLDGSLGIVAAVEACWGELVVHLLRVHVVFEQLGALVVEALELGGESSFA